MKRLPTYASMLLFTAVSSINANAQNDGQRGAEEFHELTEKQYQAILSKIRILHTKAPRTYYPEQLIEKGYRDLLGFVPLMIVVHHNEVDVMMAYSNGKFTRLNFSRVTGVWSPRNTLWTIRLIRADTVEPRKLWSTNLGMTDREYTRDQLYRKHLHKTAGAEHVDAVQPATAVDSKAEGGKEPKPEPEGRPR